MSEHTDETIIRQLRETVERQAEELAELRRLVALFGVVGDGIPEMAVMRGFGECRAYNNRKAKQCRKST